MALEFDITIDRSVPQSADVTHGVMQVTTELQGQQRIVTVQVAKDATEAGPFYGSDGTTVTAEYHEVDDAGNESAVASFSGTLSDTIAPDAPGELGLTVTAEIPDEDVPPVA
jgi:hypothetical protein